MLCLRCGWYTRYLVYIWYLVPDTYLQPIYRATPPRKQFCVLRCRHVDRSLPQELFTTKARSVDHPTRQALILTSLLLQRLPRFAHSQLADGVDCSCSNRGWSSSDLARRVRRRGCGSAPCLDRCRPRRWARLRMKYHLLYFSCAYGCPRRVARLRWSDRLLIAVSKWFGPIQDSPFSAKMDSVDWLALLLLRGIILNRIKDC